MEWAVTPRPHLLRHQLPQPGRVDARRHLRGLPAEGPAGGHRRRARRSPAASWSTRSSVCLGGTLSAMGMAYDAARGRAHGEPATLINTHTDFTRPGVLGAFTDEAHDRACSRSTWTRRASSRRSRVARTFSLMPGQRDGVQLPREELVAWRDAAGLRPAGLERRRHQHAGSDARPVPAVVLPREPLRRGTLELDGTRLDLGRRSTSPPMWSRPSTTTSCRGSRRTRPPSSSGATDKRFVLSTAGHIAAIVNPPGPKAKHWINDRPRPATTRAGRRAPCSSSGTWWDDWADWLADRAGELVAAARAARQRGPPTPSATAPGTYVHGLTRRRSPTSPTRPPPASPRTATPQRPRRPRWHPP